MVLSQVLRNGFEMTAASTDPGLYCCVLELSAGLYTPRPIVNALYGSLDTIVRIIAKEATAITAITNGNATSNTSIPYFIFEDFVVGRENTPTIKVITMAAYAQRKK